MKRKKLLEMLAGWLDKDGEKLRNHREELEDLLENLKKKKIALQQKLEKEKNKSKHKRLGNELNIVKAQHAKGVKALADLGVS